MNITSPALLPQAVQRQRRRRRLALWSTLFLLLGVALTLLVVLTARLEASRVQEQVDALAADAAAKVRSELVRNQQSLQALAAHAATSERWLADAAVLLRQNGELLRIERRAADWQIDTAVDSPQAPPLYSVIRRDDIDIDAVAACAAAQRSAAPDVLAQLLRAAGRRRRRRGDGPVPAGAQRRPRRWLPVGHRLAAGAAGQRADARTGTPA